ncbi:alanine racemase [Urechidicola vernalis]|uniref:Alanine racemase n=1 Tax=Urechidicola vernalis TaxID=3075600 RepID=A0ABU2Y9I4_9FLAO|nr:alanine racemase [Urechidicola sp. P050]MDT0553723.1 alanine racemase [Urechidicola sp. P050]
MSNHVTTLRIDLNALHFNLNYFKSKVKSETKIMAVVKAFGYGSDAIAVAQFIQNKVSYFAVAYTHEGVSLREVGIKTPILVLHPQKENLVDLLSYDLEPNLYNRNILEEFVEIASHNKVTDYPVHIKFNTGLNRLGFSFEDIDYLRNELKESLALKVKSLFSHLAASEDLNEKEFTLDQIALFKKISTEFQHKFGFMPELHLCNTSGVLNYPEAHLDMVRVGIGLYGLTNEKNAGLVLKNVLSLKSIISQIHSLKKGESIGYNRGLIAKESMHIATIPIGHADGIPRILGNGKGFVHINGQKVQIVGNVCMDMIMVDISGIECKEGDSVVIFDSQESIEELATAADTISYEMLTAISQRVRRVLVS